MDQNERTLQKKGAPSHAGRTAGGGRRSHGELMAIRKFHRDRRGEPPMTRKRAEMFAAAWVASEFARVYGVGKKRDLSPKAFPYLFEGVPVLPVEEA